MKHPERIKTEVRPWSRWRLTWIMVHALALAAGAALAWAVIEWL